MILQFLSALSFGFLTSLLWGLYGSGYLKTKYKFNLLNKVLQWIVIPFIIFEGVFLISNNPLVSLFFTLPYFWKMATGTGGDQQAQLGNSVNNPHEWLPFDIIAKLITNLYQKIYGEFFYYSQWCRVWGFIYCILTALVFSAPFYFTNLLFIIPLFAYPFMCRASDRREAEKFIGFIYPFCAILSL